MLQSNLIYYKTTKSWSRGLFMWYVLLYINSYDVC